MKHMNKFVKGAKTVGSTVKKHLLTSISYMLPLVVASGLLIAIGNLMGGGIGHLSF